MAYIVMLYIVMAYIVMADIVMAYIVMASSYGVWPLLAVARRIEAHDGSACSLRA